MKKHYEYTELQEKLSSTDLANIFNVYNESRLGSSYLVYNVSRTVNFTGLKNHSKAQFATYSVKFGDTWTTIAYDYYGDTRLWWLVCKFNNIIDPSDFPEPGTILKLPTLELVKAIVNDIRAE